MRPELRQTAHRPWPLPAGSWVMTQRWLDLLFIHWKVPVALMRELVPDELELDLFDGEALVAVVPFRMNGIRPRCCPALPWISAFPECNVRTYVKAKNASDPKPGVYFFSLEASNPLAVFLARTVFKLPYFNASISLQNDGENCRYLTERTHRGAPEAVFKGHYGPTGEVDHATPGTLDHWLTERYCLYTVSQGSVYRCEIHHRPWPLQPAFLEGCENSLLQASGIDQHETEPILHFAREIDVLVWPLQRLAD